ncbi:hypothetical protein ACFYOC_21915 [Nocardiopsis alba]|uniref:hypothetical protein n=1 Tax=Nocardiopsis alba TaxID=53437 RepID=UPI0036BD11C1
MRGPSRAFEGFGGGSPLGAGRVEFLRGGRIDARFVHREIARAGAGRPRRGSVDMGALCAFGGRA